MKKTYLKPEIQEDQLLASDLILTASDPLRTLLDEPADPEVEVLARDGYDPWDKWADELDN